jgi:hypothetical protein
VSFALFFGFDFGALKAVTPFQGLQDSSESLHWGRCPVSRDGFDCDLDFFSFHKSPFGSGELV